MTRPNAFDSVKLGPITLRNRFIKAATNEGMCKGGVISKGLAEFHGRMAKGGVALTTVAYCATSPDGRTFVDQGRLGTDTIADYRVLTNLVHTHGAAASAQITHAGCFTFLPKDETTLSKPLSSSGGFNKFGVVTNRYLKKKMNADDMQAMRTEFVKAALNAKEAGFDAVELHMGHGYLLSQFITPLYNKRSDDYGGTIEKRMQFPKEVLSNVLDAVGKDMAVIVKYSQTDGKDGGNTIEDGIKIAQILEQTGAHLAVLSNGLNVESITSMFGNALPETASASAKPKNPIVRLGMALQKMQDKGSTEFRELYTMATARQIRDAVKMPLCYLGGVQTVDNINAVLTEGFETLALGRVLVHDPEFINQVKAQTITESGCTACNHCVTMMYTPEGTHCIEKGGMKSFPAVWNVTPASKSTPAPVS